MRNRGEVFAKQRAAGVQRDAASRIPRRVLRRRPMQRAEKTGEVERGCVFVEGWRDERRVTRQPSRHAPRPGKSASRSADADRDRNGQRQARREEREPALLVLDEQSRYRAAGQANDQILAETEHPVVPPFAGVGEGKPGEVRVLLLQQRADEDDVDRRFRGRQHVSRHVSSVLLPGGEIAAGVPAARARRA
jgi:hypothetical protein